jgi:hypothetical protein
VHIAGDNPGDDFLMGGTQTKFPPSPVLEGEQALAKSQITPGFLPYFDGLEHWHGQFLPSDSSQLLADYMLDFAQDSPSQGKVRVNPSCHLMNHSRSKQQLMTWYLCLYRHLTQRLS